MIPVQCIKVEICACHEWVQLPLIANETGTWRIKVYFNNAVFNYDIAVVYGQPVVIPNKLNESYVHKLEIFTTSETLFNNVWYQLRTIPGYCGDGYNSGPMPPTIQTSVQAYDNRTSFPATGTDSVIYIARDTWKQYLWDAEHSVYLEANTPAIIGAVADVNGRTGSITLTSADVGLGNANNTADVDKPVSGPQAAADDAILIAAKTYAESLIASAFIFIGEYDASSDEYPNSGGTGSGGNIKAGNLWLVSVQGTLGGKTVSPGDSIVALVDDPGQDPGSWSQIENNFGYPPENVNNKVNSFSAGSPSQYPTTQAVIGWTNTSTIQNQNGSAQNANFNISGSGTASSFTSVGDSYINGARIGLGLGSNAYNIVFGSNTLTANTTGNNLVAIGNGALQNNTTGRTNLAIGATTLTFNTTGIYNTALNVFALYNNTTGSQNTAIAPIAMYNNIDGSRNIAIGVSSLFANQHGSYNIALGDGALPNTTGSYNIAIGPSCAVPVVSGSNQLNIGNTIYGTNVNTGTITNGSIGIGITTPSEKLEVGGNIKAANAVLTSIPMYADNATATAAGLTIGNTYRTGSILKRVNDISESDTVVITTTDFTIDSTHNFYVYKGAGGTVTLPTVFSVDREIRILNFGTGALAIIGGTVNVDAVNPISVISATYPDNKLFIKPDTSAPATWFKMNQ